MRRTFFGVLTVVGLCVLIASVIRAVDGVVISEQGSADSTSGVYIEASHEAGVGQTSVTVEGTIPGPAVNGTMVTDQADAYDGNFVQGTWAAATADTQWHVQTGWRLKGLVTKTGQPQTSPPTSYNIFVQCEIQVTDTGGTWAALTDSAMETPEIVNEAVLANESAVLNVNEKKANISSLTFRYDLRLDAYGEIDRQEASIYCRAEPFGTPVAEEDNVTNAGWIRLTNTNTGTVLIQLTPYW